MTTFDILWECLPFFALIGVGLNLLLTGLVPSWRGPGWRYWKILRARITRSLCLFSLVLKKQKPVNEGDFSEKTAVWLIHNFGSVLVLLGAIGTVWIAYLNPST